MLKFNSNNPMEIFLLSNMVSQKINALKQIKCLFEI